MSVTILGRVVFLTHIDSVCKDIKEDITNVFKSKAADDVVKKANHMTGMTIGHIFPVKNYIYEQDVNDKVSILLLLALQKIVHFSIDNITGLKEDNFIAWDIDIGKTIRIVKRQSINFIGM